jgi:hypothetical protein
LGKERIEMPRKIGMPHKGTVLIIIIEDPRYARRRESLVFSPTSERPSNYVVPKKCQNNGVKIG